MHHYLTIITALNLFFEKKSFNYIAKEISKTVSISRQIISIWINKFTNNRKLLEERIQKIAKQTILKQEEKQICNIEIQAFILKKINDNPYISRNELISLIYNEYQIRFTLNKISKIYKQCRLTFKKPSFRIAKTIDFLNRLSKQRLDFIDKIKQENIDNIISIDESGFNNTKPTKKGLSLKGKPINIPINQLKYTNHSLLMAVNTKGIVNYNIYVENINTNIFFSFIKDVILKLDKKGHVFLFDNVKFHHDKEMLKYITDNGHTYMFTPAYSPNHNPIENCFGIIKTEFRNIYSKNNKVTNISSNIHKSIINFKTKHTNLTPLFNRAFTYSYIVEENELRDRITIINNKPKINEIKEKILRKRKKIITNIPFNILPINNNHQSIFNYINIEN